MRVGFGYDAHPLVQGRPLVLGGVTVPFSHGLLGHSDGDALVHAVVEALLGASNLGDIGTHFPASDPQFKDIASTLLLERVRLLVAERGWKPHNVDATIVAEWPALRPYLDQMRNNVARCLGVDASQVSVKAKSSNGLGFTGRGEGMEAYAVVILEEQEIS